MLSIDQIIDDLTETQRQFSIEIEKDENSVTSQYLSLKFSKIITWMMQNGYVEP